MYKRQDDIPLLVNHFLKKFRLKTRKPIDRIAPEALGILRKYLYPGNVRELENAIEHAFVMCHNGIIMPEHLPLNIYSNGRSVNGVTPAKKHEKDVISETLQRNHYNRNLTAVELGVHRSTLWRKIKMYKLM